MQESIKPTPTRPYFVRAIYEWLSDNQLTPYLLVNTAIEGVEVPRAHIKDNAITLNIAEHATHGLFMDNDWIRFSARFNGASQEIFVPMSAVMGLFAKENGQGMFFEENEYEAHPTDKAEDEEKTTAHDSKKPGLRLL